MPRVLAAASSLVLLRDAASPEVLLIQRHRASRVAAGDFVFPGGKLEDGDVVPEAGQFCRGLTGPEAARRLGLDDENAALGYWIAAIREAFEEAGVLLAYDRDGQLVRPGYPGLGEYRRAGQREGTAFWRMLEMERLSLATDRLVYFAHWITPEENPIRFDTRFFAAQSPPDQEASPDDLEITAVRWTRPADALLARDEGEITLRLPTVKNLELLDGEGQVADVLNRLASRDVPMIRPRVLTEDGAPRFLLPGDPGYF